MRRRTGSGRGGAWFQAALLLSGVVGVLAAGCAATGPRVPRLGSEKSFDGLLVVENARASAAWINPDFDLSIYSKVKLQGAGIEYRPTRGRSSRASATEFPMTEGAKARLRQIMQDAFREEMAQSQRFELTDESGPDVLLVWGGLLDVVSHVPPQRGGRSDVFLRSVGAATLVIELRDSESNAILARMLDRRAAERISGGFPSNAATNAGEVRRIARTWARLLRQRLDEAPTLHGGVVVEGVAP